MVHKIVNSSLPGPLSMSNGLKYVRFWLRFRHIPEQNNILKISIKFARQNIPCQKMFPLPNTCGPLPYICGLLPNTCGLLPNICGPLPNTCGPLPNTCGDAAHYLTDAACYLTHAAHYLTYAMRSII